MNPSLQWEKQFNIMKTKLVELVAKLIRRNMNAFQVHIYFNIYMTRSVFSGCGIITLIDK